HNGDDWQEAIVKGLFKQYWHKKIDAELKILLERAGLLLSICDEMSLEYKRRYNRDFIPFLNPVELDVWKPHQRKNYDLSDSPMLLYAGRIGLGIDTSLQTMAKAIDQVNEELKMSAKFVLQTGTKPEWLGE